MSLEGSPETKRQKLDPSANSGDVSECESGTDRETQMALEAIDNIQTEIDCLNEQASDEILEVEKKYRLLRKPYFSKRNAVIEQIPNFWVTSLLNHPQIAVIVHKKEKECLQYLSKVEVEESADIKSGYNITFTFKTNPYFTNEVLCKEFHLAKTGDPVSKSTAIDWKDGMNLTKLGRSARMRKGNKRRGMQSSFFRWFLDNADPILDSIAEVIKDDMWPNPLQYYLESERDADENGMEDSDDEEELDESVVVVEDDDDDDDDNDDDDDGEIYEIEDDDYELDTTGDVEVIEEEEVGEVLEGDDDDDEDVEEIDDSKEKENGEGKEKDSGSKDKDTEDASKGSVSKNGDEVKDEGTEAM